MARVIAVWHLIRRSWPEAKQELIDRVKELWHMPSEPIEVLVCYIFAGLGITLLVPGDLAYYSTNSVWQAAHTVIPSETVAGSLMLLIAFMKLWGVLCKRIWIRRTASMAACCLFLFFMSSFLSDSVFSAWTIFLALAVASAWVFIRLGRPW